MNVENICKVADAIEREAGGVGLNMASLISWCGTAACVAGHAAIVAVGMKRAAAEVDILSAARDYLGLDYTTQGSPLFVPDGWRENKDSIGAFTPARAAAVLRHLANTGEVVWTRFGVDGQDLPVPMIEVSPTPIVEALPVFPPATPARPAWLQQILDDAEREALPVSRVADFVRVK